MLLPQDVDNIAVHVHEMHNPSGPAPELRSNTGAVVVVHRRRDNKFLMVQVGAGFRVLCTTTCSPWCGRRRVQGFISDNKLLMVQVGCQLCGLGFYLGVWSCCVVSVI